MLWLLYKRGPNGFLLMTVLQFKVMHLLEISRREVQTKLVYNRF